MTALLEVHQAVAGYGPYRALHGIDLEIEAGAVVALVGTNGAGKSTLARVLSGLVPLSSGSVHFAGRDISTTPAWRRVGLGLVQVPEGRAVFASLSVEENLLLALSKRRQRKNKALDGIYERFGILAEKHRERASSLSGGQQRLLALAPLIELRPKLLICDELSLGLAPQAVDEVYAQLASLAREGTALLLVEQRLERVRSFAERALALERGRVIADGDPAQVASSLASSLSSLGDSSQA